MQIDRKKLDIILTRIMNRHVRTVRNVEKKLYFCKQIFIGAHINRARSLIVRNAYGCLSEHR